MSSPSGAVRHGWPTFPLAVGPTDRYLVDQAGAPVLIQGDTAWSIIASATLPEAEHYFRDRRDKGFNAVIVNLIERLFAPDAPRTVDGIEPFAMPGDFATPNEAYFARAEAICTMAADYGLAVFLAPCYQGYKEPAYPGFGNQPEGWFAETLANGVEAMGEYGRFVGRRLGHLPNLVWVMSGDRCPGAALEHMRAMQAGIAEVEAVPHLFTAHVNPECSAVDEYEGDAWLTLNQTYTYGIVHRKLLDDYNRWPVRPFVLFESTYEGEHDASDVQIRRQAYWAVLSGACGQFLGTYPVWYMPVGRGTVLDSQGALDMHRLIDLFAPLPWWDLVPDQDRRLVTAGLGEGNGLDRCTAAVTLDGHLAIAYLPLARPITVDLGILASESVAARWYDPRTGEWTVAAAAEGRLPRSFTPPSAGDWILLLETA